MWFALVLVILFLVIAFVQSSHGLFSALIMTVLTICCAAAAFGCYEWVAVNWLAPRWQRDYSAGIVLAATFGVPLLVLRVVVDHAIHRSSLLPSWVDRAGGAVCGVITALVVVGVMASAVQMIPFNNGAVFGFARVPVYPWMAKSGETPEVPSADAEGDELWLKPDRFAVSLASMLSDGLFSGKRSFGTDHPDLIQATGWLNAAPLGQGRFAPPRSASVVSTQPVDFVYNLTPATQQGSQPDRFEPVQPRTGYSFQMARVKLNRAAMDQNRSHRFTLRQFRLVGRRTRTDHYEQYHPIAVQQERDEIPNRHVRAIRKSGGFWPVVDRPMVPRDGNEGQVEIVFELPDDFEPSFLEYKRCARMNISFQRERSGSRPQPSEKTATAQPSGRDPASEAASPGERGSVPSERSASGRRGNIRGVASQQSGSRFSNEMPIRWRSYRRLKSAEVRRGALVNGHLVGYLDEQAGGSDREISRFRVPSDKRLLQLNAEFLHARSGIGRALSHTVRTIQNYVVEDARGRRHKIVGKYAVANVNGRRVAEVQYFSDPVGSIGGLGDFDKINEETDLTGDYEFILLFLVDPGAQIKSFSTGGSATQAEDITSQNLVAPQ